MAIESEERRWIVTLASTEIEVAEDAGTADATIGGDPSDVLLWLWGRAPDARVSRSSDEDARLLRARLTLATQ